MAGLLSFRGFRWLWTGSLFSYAAQWIQQATLGWVVYDITGSGALLGAVFGVRAAPMLLLAPLAGVAIDRYDRRRLLMGTSFASAAIAFAFGVGLALDWVRIWHLFAFVLASGSASVLDRPARLTTIFDVVPRDHAMSAVSANSVGMSMTRIVAPAFAGYLIAWFGAAGNFYVQAMMNLVAVLCVGAMALPPRKTASRNVSAWQELSQGLKYAMNDSTTRALLALGAIPFFLLTPIWSSMLPIFAKDVFNAGPEGFGMMLAAGGFGGTLGSWFASRFGRWELQGRIQVGCVLAMCAALLGLAIAPSMLPALVLLVIVGGTEMALFAHNQTLLQMAAPEAMRGRMASLLQLYPAFISLGGIVVGSLAELVGARLGTTALSLVALVLTVALYASSKRLQTITLSEYR